MKILVIDDEAVKCRLYKEELEGEGYSVMTATDTEEAMGLFKDAGPDLVTLDVAMPSTAEKEGLNILRLMKAMKPTVPIILLTAFDFTDDMKTWAADKYIVKSSSTDELKSAIRELLRTERPATIAHHQSVIDRITELEKRVSALETRLAERR